MKIQYLYLLCVLMIMMMLCGCTAAASDAASQGTRPDFPAESNLSESTAQTGRDHSGADDMEGAGSAAPENAQAGRTLNADERQALWARLEGKWILSDLQEWKQSNGFLCPVYEFSVTDYGSCCLWLYSAYGSGGFGWEWLDACEQDGVYTFRAVSEHGEMNKYVCYQESGTLFTLQFTGDGILLAQSGPARFEWWDTWEEFPSIIEVRLATEAEQERLANEGDEYGQLRLYSEGRAITAGYEQAAQAYRSVTDEELEELMQ